MTTRDLGFIVGRALAVYLVFMAIGEAGNVTSFLMTSRSMPEENPVGIGYLCVFGLHLLLAWQLWLHADKLGGPIANWPSESEGTKPFVHLMLTGIGVWMIASSLTGVAMYLTGAVRILAEHYKVDLWDGSYLLVPFFAGICLLLYPIAVRKGGLLQIFGWPTKEELAEE